MGFVKPSLPTQPREGSHYLGEHHHSGKKGDNNRKSRQRCRMGRGRFGSGALAFLNRPLLKSKQ